jgi:predicted nucleic acid-binding protein
MGTRLEQAIQKLTPEQVRSVEDYAEFLAARRARPTTPPSEPNRIAMHITHPEFMLVVVDTASKQKLDCDDAYQYAIAEQDDLLIVSLDADFDRTTRGRLTPEQALQKLRS